MKHTEKNPFNCKFGTNLAAIRNKKKLSQADLAELIDVTTNYISSIEKGRRGVSLPGLVKIAKALEVDSSDLLEGL